MVLMNGGEGQTSYANNSMPQRRGLYMLKPLVEEAILKMCSTTVPESFAMADLGCACGPNTLVLTWIAGGVIHNRCRELRLPSPEFHVFLNDLPDNDFNTVFKNLPAFYDRLHEEKGDEFGPCFIAAVPGSFYGRLFPKRSLHLACSSFGLHWLSQVPEELKKDEMLNRGNINLDKSSPYPVFGAYLGQFQKDFTLFLESRSKEIAAGGHMILTLMGRRTEDPFNQESAPGWEPVKISLNDMVSEGLIEETTVDSFNLPFYEPYMEELRAIVKLQGSFAIDKLEEREWWDDLFNSDAVDPARDIANMLRAVLESLLVSHFGTTVIPELFRRVEMNLSKTIPQWKEKQVYLVASLIKKA